ncbi:gag-pol polyprotein [Lasius niger]|uniref:Gag-pol polyprotein n=1 Tax=Lasius niger TaxID=67767 RepID=A0A0J7KLU4_LASNI|nr:gag-pol polyprotein [Lasius niger]
MICHNLSYVYLFDVTVHQMAYRLGQIRMKSALVIFRIKVLAAKAVWQENQISELRLEVRILKSLLGNHPISLSNVSIMASGGLSVNLVSPGRIGRSPSVLRSDNDITLPDSSLSMMDLSFTLPEGRHSECIGESSLVKEMLKVEDSIIRKSAEISSKNASLLELDAAAESALANIALFDPRDNRQEIDRVGRARRRGEANHAQYRRRNAKRKARKVSPDAPSEEEPGLGSSTQSVPRVVLRKLRSRKRKPKEVADVPIEEVSSAQMSTDSDWGSENRELIEGDSDLEITGNGSDSEVGRKKKIAQGSSKGRKKGGAQRRSLTSSEEDEDSHFAPEELRAMGATAAGSLALECLDDVEGERKNSPNINGQAEASGDPALLRLKNRELTEKVQQLRLNEVVVKRELEDMRSLVDTLRKEIADLKDRVNEAEEDRRKSRESQRIMLWRHKKERGETVCESPTVLMDDPPVQQVASVNRKVDIPSGSQAVGTIETSRPSSSSPSVLPAHKGKGLSAENKARDINNQIRNLVRQRAELKRQAVEDSGTGSDRQRLVPPRSEGKGKVRPDKNIPEPKESIVNKWTEVRRRDSVKPRMDQRLQERGPRDNEGLPKANTSRRPRNTIRKPPKTSAVMITGQGEEFSYADALKKARESISLKDLHIERTKVRRAANGGMLIEVIGPDSARKALELKEKLSIVLKNEAQITRPVVRGEIRLIGLDASTTPVEVKDVIIGCSGCLDEDIRVGVIRPMANGLFTVWVQCPLSAAVKVANLGKVRIGWTSARVDLLEVRPTQCFRCWQFGHLRHSCQSKDDYSGLCFSMGLRDFNSILDDLSLALSNRVDKLIIGGDFNAKACLWGASHTDGRGRLTSIWAAERDLRVANVGNRPTCIRAQGSSIVDLTWVSSDILPFIRNWQVEEETESLSDHLYISCFERLPVPSNLGPTNVPEMEHEKVRQGLVQSCP